MPDSYFFHSVIALWTAIIVISIGIMTVTHYKWTLPAEITQDTILWHRQSYPKHMQQYINTEALPKPTQIDETEEKSDTDIDEDDDEDDDDDDDKNEEKNDQETDGNTPTGNLLDPTDHLHIQSLIRIIRKRIKKEKNSVFGNLLDDNYKMAFQDAINASPSNYSFFFLCRVFLMSHKTQQKKILNAMKASGKGWEQNRAKLQKTIQTFIIMNASHYKTFFLKKNKLIFDNSDATSKNIVKKITFKMVNFINPTNLKELLSEMAKFGVCKNKITTIKNSNNETLDVQWIDLCQLFEEDIALSHKLHNIRTFMQFLALFNKNTQIYTDLKNEEEVIIAWYKAAYTSLGEAMDAFPHFYERVMREFDVSNP